MKLIKKERIGAKIKKIFDEPKTPYQRALESEFISDKRKEKLRTEKAKLNPFTLRIGLEIKLKEFKDTLLKYKNLLYSDWKQSYAATLIDIGFCVC